MCRYLVIATLCLSGCASLDFTRAEWCVRKKLEVEIPLDRGTVYKPRPCKSKEIFNRLF